MNPSQLLDEQHFQDYFGNLPKRKRVVVRPVPQSHKTWMDLGDLGQQEVNVLYTREENGIDINSVSFKGLVITGAILDIIELGRRILEEIE